MQKVCTGCGEAKPKDAYQRNAEKRDGLQSRCRECRAAAAALYRERTRESRLAYNRAYNEARRAEGAKRYRKRGTVTAEDRAAEAVERTRRWREANSERYKAGNRANYVAKRDDILAQQREYRSANRDRYNEHSRVYLMRKRGQFVERVDALVVLETFDGACGICGGDVDPFSFHLDHIIPISAGGEHSYANVQPAHPSCNLSKGAHM